MTRAIFVDTETTGLGPDRRIWEICFIEAEIGGIGIVCKKPHVFQVALTEVELEQAHPVALEIGRFHERRWDPVRQITPKGLAELAKRLTAGCLWYGNVPSFDAIPLEEVMRRFGMVPAWDYHLQCCEVLAAGFLAARGYPHHELHKSAAESRTGTPSLDHRKIVALLEKETGEQIAVSEDEKHTALGDTMECVRMVAAVHGLEIGKVEW